MAKPASVPSRILAVALMLVAISAASAGVAAAASPSGSMPREELLAQLTAAQAKIDQLEARLAASQQQPHDTGTPDDAADSSFAPSKPDVDWVATRSKLVATLFGTNGTLPSRSTPDYIQDIPGPITGGCWCAMYGYCNASDCQWGNNMTQITWTIEAQVNASYTLSLNSTVFLSLNTSGVAASIIPELGPPTLPSGGWNGDQHSSGREPAMYPKARQKTLVIFHHGHAQPCDECPIPWVDQNTDYLNQLGYDAMTIQMPLHQCNYVAESGCNHEWFAQFEAQGVHTMRYFLEPAVLSINYALEELGYEHIIFMGLSGGGWTTTLMGAIDPRITLSMPIAGSIPCDFKHTSYYEQFCTNEWAQVCNYTCLYTLAALEEHRSSVQIIHEHDPCCFHGFGRHERVIAYNEAVQSQVAGHFETVITVGNVHEVNVRDKSVVSYLMDNLRVKGTLTETDFASIPFNTLRQWGP